MSKIFFALALLFAVISALFISVQAKNWAVLVAGSDEYYNYRHQSDICHSYQILKKNGIADENIIVFMKDDIANNAQNPKKGQIINFIGGPDVYHGVPKDYTGSLVTPDNFLKVLKGENMTVGSKKTLKTGPEDNIFVFFSDHGSEGLIAFPSSYLYAKDLMNTLKSMNANKKYGKFLFYIEACESGSMFHGLLPADMKIYGHTASNPYVSSWACDMDKSVNAYLNDCWSRNWMNDTELHTNSLSTYTVGEQFNAVKKTTTQSPACKYGDLSLEKDAIGIFQAVNGGLRRRPVFDARAPLQASGSRINSREVKTAYLKHMTELTAANGNAAEHLQWKSQLNQHIELRSKLDMAWNMFASRLGVDVEPEEQRADNADDQCNGRVVLDHDCIKDATEMAIATCGNAMRSEENLPYLRVLSRACSKGLRVEEQKVVLEEICSTVRL